MSTLNNFNDLPPVQSLSMIISSSTIEMDPVKDAQGDYDTKVSQLSQLNSKIKSGWFIYLVLTTRYIRVVTDMGFFCTISDMSDTVVQEGELGYPNTFNLSGRHWEHESDTYVTK